jgi:hypothetical protein
MSSYCFEILVAPMRHEKRQPYGCLFLRRTLRLLALFALLTISAAS